MATPKIAITTEVPGTSPQKMTFTNTAIVAQKATNTFDGIAIPVGTATPSGAATTGSLYFDSDAGTYGTLYIYNGSAWKAIAFTA